MAKVYTKGVWVDEVLAGAERYDIKDNAGVAINSNTQIVLATGVTVAGTPVNASALNNIEWAVDAFMNGGGWIPGGAWTYASPNSINVPGGAGNHSSYVKIRWTQGGASKYAYAWPYSDTLLVIFAGSDFTVENVGITDTYYSHAEKPVGFPQWFNLTVPVWTTTGTAFTNQPVNSNSKFCIVGRVLKIEGTYTCHATSGGTGIFIATYAAGELPAFVSAGIGGAQNYTTFLGGPAWVGSSLQNAVKMSKYDAFALATNSGVFAFSISVEI